MPPPTVSTAPRTTLGVPRSSSRGNTAEMSTTNSGEAWTRVKTVETSLSLMDRIRQQIDQSEFLYHYLGESLHDSLRL